MAAVKTVYVPVVPFEFLTEQEAMGRTPYRTVKLLENTMATCIDNLN